MRILGLLLIFTCLPLMAAVPSLSEFTKDMHKADGFVSFYYESSQDKVYLSIDKLNQSMIFQSSLPYGVGSNDIGLDRGQLGDTRLVEFRRYGNKVMLVQVNTEYRADTPNTNERKSIDEAFADSVIAGFEVVAADENTLLIDYTPFLFSDIHGISKRLSDTQQGSFKADPKRSGVVLERSKTFEKNTELEAMVTFGGSQPGQYVSQVTPDPTSITVHLHHSFVALPEPGYQMRAYHPYSGYWKFRYFDYATPIDAPTEKRFIYRHRLAKQHPEQAVSEPVEPIVYYLDPGIPEPVFSALKEGASWWNQAFEAIGYKNAFVVKTLPDGADPMDVCYNVIQWVHRATRGWSYGASVSDPRTGEIIKGHVTLGSLRVRQDYLIALGLTSPFAGDNSDTTAQQELALARIRQLSAHEVGHTLGIAHNFAASEQGRESVMDYPHPLIALKDGKVILDEAYDSGMGEWDKHAVAYGYQDFTGQSEAQGLSEIIAAARDKALVYKTDADTRASHHASANGHMWDNGGNPLEAFDATLALRSHALTKLGLNTLPDGASLSSLEDALVPVYLLHRYALEAVAKQVGGVNYEYERKGDYPTPKGQTFVEPSVQRRAIKQLIKATSADVLRIPASLIRLIPPTAYGDDITREHFASRISRVLDPHTMAESAAGFALDLMLTSQRLNRLAYQRDYNRDVPSVSDVIGELIDAHWERDDTDYPALNNRLQLVVLTKLIEASSNELTAPEVKIQIDEQLTRLQRILSKSRDAKPKVVAGWLEHYLKSGEWLGEFKVMSLPPGSPI